MPRPRKPTTPRLKARSQTKDSRYLLKGSGSTASSFRIPTFDFTKPLGTSLDGPQKEFPMEVLERGKLQMDSGNYEKAKLILEEALVESRKAWGDGDEKTLVAMSILGILLHKMNDLEQAKELYVEALAGYRKSFGDTHPDTLACINNLGLLEKKMGDLEAAELLYEEALAGSREALGEAHPDTLQSIKNLAALLYSMGQFAEALPLFRESLAGRRAQLGSGHVSTKNSAVGVFNTLTQLGDKKGAAAVRAEFEF